MLLALLFVLAALPTCAADDDVPSFKKRGDNEKEWVTAVGTAIVKAARSGPKDVTLDRYKFEDVRKGRRDLHVTMTYLGGITKKKFEATIVVRIDVTDEKEWEVLDVEYSDDGNIRRPKGIPDLIKKFNR